MHRLGGLLSAENLEALAIALLLILILVLTSDASPRWIYQGF
ncbi:MAG TPA: hypothetical protein VFI11_01065 [Anaerolineales bacterium]|nr:hypothetical protein [Anaerolineales bacterium]